MSDLPQLAVHSLCDSAHQVFGAGRVVEFQRRAVGNYVVEDVAHSIAVLTEREDVKFERQQIMLPGLTVAIAIRLVQSRIKARAFLAVLSAPCSRLHLDILVQRSC